MRYQFEELDLLEPWPTFTLREGYHAVRVLVRIGTIPIGEVKARPARSRKVTPQRLRRRMNDKIAARIMRTIAREAVAAGPDAITSAGDVKHRPWAPATRDLLGELVNRELLHAGGIPEPWNSLCRKAQSAVSFSLPRVTVAVCTRDRPRELEECIKHLLEQNYPDFQVLIVDNSKDPGPTFEIAQRLGVPYTREPVAGLSRARNAALAAPQRTRWVAFTDDDCRPESNWLRELVRELQDTNCRCVTGLVLPAQLENAAEITFEVYGGLGRGYAPVVYPPNFIKRGRTAASHTWDIGAGANMLLDADLVQWLGGYDEDMGPGGVGGCGEDTDVFYKIMRCGHSIHYAPRAIVHHYHRSSPEALRKQISSYAIGHAAYHTRCFFAYGDYRSVIHLCYHLPRWFYKNFWRAFRGNTKYPFSLIKLEVKGTIKGVRQYSAVKTKKYLKNKLAQLTLRKARVKAPERAAEEKLMSYGDVTVKKSARVA